MLHFKAFWCVIWYTVNEKATAWQVKLVDYPVVGLIYPGSIGSFFGLDFLYGVGMAIGLPNLIISLNA